MAYTIADLYQCLSVMHNDAEDTIAKVVALGSKLQSLMDLIDDRIDVIIPYSGTSEVSTALDELYTYFTDKPSIVVGSSIITMTMDRRRNFTNHTYGLTLYFSKGSDDLGAIKFDYKWNDGVTIHDSLMQVDRNDGEGFVDFNTDEVNLMNIIFSESGINIPSFNIAGIISQLKTTIQTQTFFQDIGRVIGSKMDFNTLISKWSTLSDLTGISKSIFNKFTSNVTSNKDSMLQYLFGNYFKAKDTQADDDGNITWSSTEDVVHFCFSSVLSVVGQVISTVVTAVCTVIGGVFYALGAAVSAIGQLVSKFWNTATNPLIEYNEDKPAAIPVPLCQLDDSEHDISRFADLYNYDSYSMHGPLFIARCWSDAATNHRCLEIFLKPFLSASDIHDQNIQTLGLGAFSGPRSLYDICVAAKARRLEYNRPDLPCAPQESQLEAGQGIIILANLFILMRAFFKTSYDLPTPSDTTGGCWSIITDDSSTDEEKMANAIKMCQIAWQLIADNSIYEKIIKNTTANNEALMLLHFGWYDAFNVIVPLIRKAWTDIADNIPQYWPDFRILNEQPNYYFNSLGVSVDNYAYPCSTYGITIPRNTSKGVILGLITTVALAAVVAVGAALITINVKKAITKLQIKKSTQVASALDNYKMACAGLDYNDPTGSTTKEYTEEEKKELLNKYYKSAKKYNRMSALWGGSTWSMANGWDDGSPDPVSTPDLSSISDLVTPEISSIVSEDISVDDSLMKKTLHSIVG